MAEYKHGVYGQIQAAGSRVANQSRSAICYIGTAPVHNLENGSQNVNKPILVENIAQAKKLFGYSENWTDYTLCEAMHAHFELNGVGPLVLINVLDPSSHKETTGGTAAPVPENGQATVLNAEKAVLDSLVVKKTVESEQVTLVKGVDYTAVYNSEKGTIVIQALTDGVLGTTALAVTYDIVKPDAVDADDVIGATDGAGNNTGLYTIKNIYQATGYIPAYLLAPGFAELPTVHTAMNEVARKVNKHWDAYVFADIPIVNSEGAAITLLTANTWKNANGYNKENETVYFPMAKGIDGKIYHLSVLAAANFQALLLSQGGVPYKTASNTASPVIESLYLGAEATGMPDDSIINEQLNKNGIASAAYIGGKWVIWGCHSADYNQNDKDNINVSETARMMLYFVSNDFQLRRAGNVDKPMTANDFRAIIAEEQARLDGLVKAGALIYGEVTLDANSLEKSDIIAGDWKINFRVTTTPLAKSLTAVVNWTDEGFESYFESFTE